MIDSTNKPSLWRENRVLRETKLASGETLSLVEHPESGARAWLVRGIAGATCQPALHPALLPVTDIFESSQGTALVFPSLEAATLRDALDTLKREPDSQTPLGQRLLAAVRSQLLVSSPEQSLAAERSDRATWALDAGRLIADLCLQITRIAMQIEAQHLDPFCFRAERLLLTPFGRIVFWELPTTIENGVALRGVGEIVAELASLAPREDESLANICYAAHPDYPQDRYESLADLAADLDRYLTGNPVIARRPGAVLRGTREFLARPRRVAAVFCLLAAGTSGVLWGMSGRIETPAQVAPPAPKEKPASQESKPEPEFKPKPRANRGPNAPSWDRAPGASFPSSR